jgi:cell division protein FtsB
MNLDKIKDFMAWVSAMFALVLVIGMMRGSSDLGKYFELKNNLSNLQEIINEIEKKNENLESEIHRIKTSPLYARKILKDRYHVVDDNEDIIFFPD